MKIRTVDKTWLQKWRADLGMTQAQAAKALGYSNLNSYAKMERGERPIDKRMEFACRWVAAQAAGE